MTDAINKELGKIEQVKFGRIGYQDMEYGAWFLLTNKVGSVQHIITDHEALKALLSAAKVNTIDQLTDKPVEMLFARNGAILSFRLLTEVL